jgi:hypothetical protein
MTSISTPAAAQAEATTPKYGAAFFEHLWRGAGVQSVAFALIGLVIFNIVGQVGPYIAAPIFGLAILNLTWFMAALRTTLADHGLDGWGAAATTASAGVAGMFLVLVAVATTIASIAGSADAALVSGLTTFGSAAFVLSSFPRAMLVMAGSFGFWRASMITNRQFAVAVALVILGVAGGTTWFTDGFWAPDGLYSLVILPALELVWVVAASRVLNRAPSTRTGF